MFVKLLTDKSLKALKDYELSNLNAFMGEGPKIEDYETFNYPYAKLEMEEYPALEFVSESSELWETDFRNSLTLFRALAAAGQGEGRFPLSVLFDERYMAYLSHFVYFNYMQNRWPVKGEQNAGRASSQYFFKRAPEARHGILRLIWPAYLISAGLEENEGSEVFEKRLKFFFKNRLTFDRILERRFSRGPKLFSIVLKAVSDLQDPSSISRNGRSGLLGKVLNNVLGTISLDSMDEGEVYKIVYDVAERIANGSYDTRADKRDDKNIEDAEDEEVPEQE